MDLDEHKRLMKELRESEPGSIITDGPVDPERYARAHPRILWVLREANKGEDTGSWDLCEFLREHDHDVGHLFSYGRWHVTFGAVAKISLGILERLPVEKVATMKARDAVGTLRDIAVVNVNKRGGRSRVTDWENLKRAAKEFGPLVDRQYQALEPDIVIAAGTLDLLSDTLAKQAESFGEEAIDAIPVDHGWMVKCYHTGQRRLKHHVLYNRICDALNKAGWRHSVR